MLSVSRLGQVALFLGTFAGASVALPTTTHKSESAERFQHLQRSESRQASEEELDAALHDLNRLLSSLESAEQRHGGSHEATPPEGGSNSFRPTSSHNGNSITANAPTEPEMSSPESSDHRLSGLNSELNEAVNALRQATGESGHQHERWRERLERALHRLEREMRNAREHHEMDGLHAALHELREAMDHARHEINQAKGKSGNNSNGKTVAGAGAKPNHHQTSGKPAANSSAPSVSGSSTTSGGHSGSSPSSHVSSHSSGGSGAKHSK